MQLLAEHWQTEQAIMKKEIKNLSSNLQHIKDIISTQQNLSKLTGVEHVISLGSMIEEALLISGLDLGDHHIRVEKKYENKTIVSDKVKLLQILVNLLRNAKESLMSSADLNKILIIKLTIKNNKLILQIIDNGVGVPPENVSKLFTYGFTTKENGHGFGLHMCAITAKEMGGTIYLAEMSRFKKGANFTLELPYKPSL